jgi:hypothetical protein
LIRYLQVCQYIGSPTFVLSFFVAQLLASFASNLSCLSLPG